MNRYQEELNKIRTTLQNHPRGMTIHELSMSLNINRNSVAKYTDVLLALGQIELKRVGPAKLYFLSQRVPISSILNFSSDFIAVFNKNYEIIQINDAFLDFMKIKRKDIVGHSIKSAPSFISSHTKLLGHLKDGFNGIDSTETLLVNMTDGDYYLRIKFIPTIFDNGESGVTLIIEDVTEKRIAREKLKENETKLNILFQQHPDPVLFINSENRITEANPAAMRAMRLNENNLGNITYYDLIRNAVSPDGTELPPEDMTISIALKEKRSMHNVLRGIKGQNNEIYWYKVTTIPVLDDKIDIKGAYLIAKYIEETQAN